MTQGNILNNHMLNVLQAENRTLDFHIYEKSDEMFYCIEGEFDIEFEDGLTHLCEGDFIIIPKGTKHRPVCKALVKCLLIEVVWAGCKVLDRNGMDEKGTSVERKKITVCM